MLISSFSTSSINRGETPTQRNQVNHEINLIVWVRVAAGASTRGADPEPSFHHLLPGRATTRRSRVHRIAPMALIRSSTDQGLICPGNVLGHP